MFGWHALFDDVVTRRHVKDDWLAVSIWQVAGSYTPRSVAVRGSTPGR